jgi:glycosyltransferase involved in cell wall biosynthesis
MKKKFTILTSSNNCGKYLKGWAKSIIAQTHRPLEVVFVDDRSKDRTKYVIQDLTKKILDNGIELKVLYNDKRRYCGSSYSKALSVATGDFFGVLDADDALKKTAVKYVYDLYQEYPDIAWIYTQFDICNMTMKTKKRGWCKAPSKGRSLLDLGAKHAFSHWRTFSRRIQRLDKVFQKGLRCAVDKYMGYRLEELGPGLFTNKVCYKYRQRYSFSISTSEDTKGMWKKLRKEARKRRKLYNYTVYPITVHKNK